MWYNVEICKILGEIGNLGKFIWFIYSDGGLDYRVIYFSVKLLLIVMFFFDNCDYVFVMRNVFY